MSKAKQTRVWRGAACDALATSPLSPPHPPSKQLARKLVGHDHSKGGGGGDDEEDEQWTEASTRRRRWRGGEGAQAAASEHKSVVMVGVQTRAGAREKLTLKDLLCSRADLARGEARSSEKLAVWRNTRESSRFVPVRRRRPRRPARPPSRPAS